LFDKDEKFYIEKVCYFYKSISINRIVRIRWVLIIIPNIKILSYNEDVDEIYLDILKIFQGFLLIVRININQEEDKIIIKEGNKINIIIVYNVSSEREVKLRDLNVDVYYSS